MKFFTFLVYAGCYSLNLAILLLWIWFCLSFGVAAMIRLVVCCLLGVLCQTCVFIILEREKIKRDQKKFQSDIEVHLRGRTYDG